MSRKVVRLAVNGDGSTSTPTSSATTPQYIIEAEGGEFKERQRRRSAASSTAGAIKSILKTHPPSSQGGSDCGGSTGGGRTATLKVEAANEDRRSSIMSGSSYSKCVWGEVGGLGDGLDRSWRWYWDLDEIGGFMVFDVHFIYRTE